MRKYIYNLLVVLSLFFIVFVVISFFTPNYYHNIYFFVVMFFFLLSGYSHYTLIKVAKEKMIRFSTKFMMLSGIKLFVSLIFISIYLYFNRVNIVPFIIVFLVSYVVFTTLEVTSLLKMLKTNK